MIPYTISKTPIIIIDDAASAEGEQNPCPGRITLGVPDTTFGSYLLSSAACTDAADNAIFTLFNLSMADEFPPPELLRGNDATSRDPGDVDALILLVCKSIKNVFCTLLEMSNKQLPSLHRQSIEDATAEAEARQLDYHPAERAKYIRSMLQDITGWMNQGETKEMITERIPYFVEIYPELFKKIITKQDLTPIFSMLNMLDKMAKGQLSQHQASIQVGQQLVDRYVTPQLNSAAERKSEH